MTYKDLMGKDKAELTKMDAELRLELFNLKLKHGTAQLEKTHQLKMIRIDLARIQTRLGDLSSKVAAA